MPSSGDARVAELMRGPGMRNYAFVADGCIVCQVRSRPLVMSSYVLSRWKII